MASLGSFLLLTAFVIAAYAAAASVAGARRRNNRLIESGVGAFYTVAAIMTVASGVIVYAFVAGDYSIRYVQRYSDSVQPFFYRITSYWGGLDGSVMFWVFLLSLFGSVAVRVNRERHRELMPYVVAIISAVEMFFLFLMVIHNNPFDTFLTQSPTDGRGLNPLLQNFYMAIHPPLMYLGFVGLTIPFAFGLSALITGHLDDSWLRAVRRWTMFSWFFLSFGLTLGMIWAYEELGWGGFWGWDPVENAGLLPWFTATAFLHSVMVQERRGMLRVWNVTLVIITFLLTIFGTFMTRSGVVQSVHAFGDDPALARLFMAFMAVVAVFSFSWVIYRLPLLQARHELDSWVSREAAFLANNWILLFSAFFVLFATMFPTITETINGERLTVGPPFFNRWMTPIGLALLALTGIGPLLAWRKSTIRNLVDQFVFPVVLALVVSGALVVMGVRVWSSGICFALCALTFGTIAQEFYRGANVRRGMTGTDILTAMIGLVGRNKRRYGGYIVHLGILLMFLGFAGEGFSRDEQLLLKPGEKATVGNYELTLDALRVTDDGQKQMVTAHVSVKDANGKDLGRMYPAKWYYRKHEEEPTTEVGIRRSIAEDLYIVMPAFELQDQTASVEVHINPLVDWVWFGFGIMAVGTGIALLPERALSFAMAPLPAGAVTASLLVLALLLAPALASAQHVEDPNSTHLQVFPKEVKDVTKKLACWCGGCSKLPVGECSCGHCALVKGEVTQMMKDGQSEDAVLAHYVQPPADHAEDAVHRGQSGNRLLSEPPNAGAGRLAWMVPYLVGLFGLFGAGVFALRWSHRPAVAGAAGMLDEDDSLRSRLDMSCGTSTRLQASGFRLQEEPRTPNPEPRTWNRTPNPEPRTPNPEPRTPNPMSQATESSDPQLDHGLPPWQFFLLCGMLGATAVVIVATGQAIANILILSATVVAASVAGLAAYRMLSPLVSPVVESAPVVAGGRTRAALEREKTLVLRSIKELEFDRAMGKIAQADFDEMGGRMRRRALRLIQQLDTDATAGYREQIERELATLVTTPDPALGTAPRTLHSALSTAPGTPHPAPRTLPCPSCDTANDPDARFCKQCGTALTAS